MAWPPTPASIIWHRGRHTSPDHGYSASAAVPPCHSAAANSCKNRWTVRRSDLKKIEAIVNSAASCLVSSRLPWACLFVSACVYSPCHLQLALARAHAATSRLTSRCSALLSSSLLFFCLWLWIPRPARYISLAGTYEAASNSFNRANDLAMQQGSAQRLCTD